MNRRALLATTLAAACAPGVAFAQNRQPPHTPPFTGLLPDGHQLVDAPQPIPKAAISAGKAVIVPSDNYNRYTTEWVEKYEGGGAERNPWARLFAMDASAFVGMRQTSDPRLIADRMVATLQPYFQSVAVATDLVAARDQGADFYVVLDYWAAFDWGGTRYRTRSGVHMLDRDLRRLFATEHRGEVKRVKGPAFSPRGQAEAVASTFALGLDAASAQMADGIRVNLGPPPS